MFSLDFGVAKFRRLLFVSCIGLASTNLIDLTDTVIAGHLLGEAALSAVNLFWPWFDFQFFVCMAIASGSAILHSRAVGAFDAQRASKIFSNGLFLALAVGLTLAAGFWFLRASAESFYGVTGETRDLLRDYWKVFTLEVAVFPVYVYVNTMVASDGDTVIGTASYLTELVVNAVASYGLCRHCGIAGCAAASLLSTLAGLAVAALHFLRKANSLTLCRHFSLRDSLRAVWADLPEASVSLFSAIVYVVMNKVLLVAFGESVLPVMTAVIITNGFALFLYGVPPAAQPIVGVYRAEGNFGAVRRVMRAALATSFLFGAVTGGFFLLFPALPVRLIGIVTPSVFAQACQAVRIVSCALPFVGVAALFTAYYLYVERTSLSLALIVLQGLAFPVAFSAAGAFAWGESGFWGGYMAATPLALVAFFGILGIFCRNRCARPPWFLDASRNAFVTTWTLRTDPAGACRIAEAVQEKLRQAGAPPKTVMKAALLVEDSLMEIRARNGERDVLAEVMLDFAPGAAARIVLRDDGTVGTLDTPAAGRDDAVRHRVLDAVRDGIASSRSRVTTGFNRHEFVL